MTGVIKPVENCRELDNKEPIEQDREQKKLTKIQQRMAVVSGLNAQQRTAVCQYLLHGNKTKAYEEAGYSAKYADRAASRLFKNSKIIDAIEEYFHAEEMSAREAVAILSKQARGSMEDFIKFDEYLDPELDLDKARDADQLPLVKKFKKKRITYTDKDQNETLTEWVEVELYDAQTALDKIMRYHGAYQDRTDVTSGGEKVQTIAVVNMDVDRLNGGDK